MKATLFYLLLTLSFLLFFCNLTAQELKQEPESVHKTHKMQFGENYPNLQGEKGDIIPLRNNKSKQLSAAVFGYFPYWQYPSGVANMQWDVLTHIAAFDFEADSLGGLSNPSGWPWTGMINTAHTNGVKVVMCVTAFDAKIIRKIITDTTSKRIFFQNVKNKITTYQLDGVNIDFEGPYTADRGSLMNTFMSDLTAFIHGLNSSYEVSFAAPAINWGGWQLYGLANACDYLFVMGYDFYGSWSTETGPSAPLSGGYYNVKYVLNTEYATVISVNPKKIILGVPYYGNEWYTKTSSAHSTIRSFIQSLRYNDLLYYSTTYGTLWASDNQTPWYRHQVNDTTWLQGWFDNDTSLGLKYGAAKSKNLKGVGMWALNFDGARPELWNKLRQMFPTSVNDNQEVQVSEFKLNQNYPNPFNPSTIISYKLGSGAKVTLEVYDVLGKRIKVFDEGVKSSGSYNVELNLAGSSSGVYFCKMIVQAPNTGEKVHSEVKSMVLVK